MTLWIVKDPRGDWAWIIRSDRVPEKHDDGSYWCNFDEYGDNTETLGRIPLPEVEPGACYRVTLERVDDTAKPSASDYDRHILELERRVSDLESRVMHLQSPTYVLRPMPFGDVPPPSCTCEASRKGE